MMKRLGLLFVNVILGAVAFWTPTLALLPPTTSEKTWLVAGALAPPAALLLFCTLAVRFRKTAVDGPSSCLFALVGIWLTGPSFMTLAAILRTPNLLHTMGPADCAHLALMSLIPPYTLYLAAAQGSGYALVLATILMPVWRHIFESDRWLIPPRLTRRFHLGRSGRRS